MFLSTANHWWETANFPTQGVGFELQTLEVGGEYITTMPPLPFLYGPFIF